MRENLVCICCPAGCRLTVSSLEQGDWKVEGNRCARGRDYAITEMTDPRRVLTCLMRIEGKTKPISVKSDIAIPKAMLMDCAKAIYRMRPKAPVKAGEILVRDLLGTGANIIATRASE